MGHFFICSFFLKIEDTKFFIIPLFNIVWQVGIFGLEFVIDSDAQVSNTVLGPHFIIIMMSYNLKDSFVILTLIFGTDMYNCEVYSNNRKESQMFHQVLRPPQTLYVD